MAGADEGLVVASGSGSVGVGAVAQALRVESGGTLSI